MRFLPHVLFLLVFIVSSSATLASTNVLLGKRAEFSIEPKYLPSAALKNPTNLTDGKFKSRGILDRYFLPWTNDATVTWQLKRKLGVRINYDLGEKHTIDKLVLKTHGDNQVTFPLSFKAFISNNGTDWQYVGDLVDKTISTYYEQVSHVFTLDGLNVEGRYLAFFAYKSGLFICLDEIEAYSTNRNLDINDSVYNVKSIDDYVKNGLDLMKQKKTSSVIISEAKRYVNSCSASPSSKIVNGLNNLQKEVDQQSSILPQSEEQLGLPYTVIDGFAVNFVAEHFKSLLKEDFTINKISNEDIYKSYGAFYRPCVKNNDTNFNVKLARNDQESIGVQIANNTQSLKNLSYDIVLKSKVNNTAWPADDIKVYKSVNVLHAGLALSDEMLAPLYSKQFEAQSGINQMLWVKFDSEKVSFGDYEGYLSITSGNTELKRFSLNVNVNPLKLDFSEHFSNTWTHLDKISRITNNKPRYLQELNKSHDNVQTIVYEQLPWPQVNPVTKTFYEPMRLNFSRMDELIKSRPDVKLWLISPFLEYAGRPQLNYHGASITHELYSDEHKAFVKKWIKSIVSHMKSLNISKEDYAFYWLDEAKEDTFLKYVVPFSRMTKEVDKDVQIYGTHFLPVETLLKYPHVYDIHVLTEKYLYADSRYFDYAKKYNKTIYPYSVYNMKSVDPYRIRLLHANAYARGLNGASVWGWNDTGGSVNEILSSYPSQALIYRTKTGPASSKRREAWREGNEDVALWRAFSKLDPSFDMRSHIKKSVNLIEYRKNSKVYSKNRDRIFEKTKKYPHLYTLPVLNTSSYKMESSQYTAAADEQGEQTKYKTCLKPNKLISAE